MKEAQYPKEFVSKALSILGAKGKDYGARGKNFFEAAAIATIITGETIKPLSVVACLIGIKLSRYGNLVNRAKSSCEPIQDTVVDTINYMALLEEVRQLILLGNKHVSKSKCISKKTRNVLQKSRKEKTSRRKN